MENACFHLEKPARNLSLSQHRGQLFDENVAEDDPHGQCMQSNVFRMGFVNTRRKLIARESDVAESHQPQQHCEGRYRTYALNMLLWWWS